MIRRHARIMLSIKTPVIIALMMFLLSLIFVTSSCSEVKNINVDVDAPLKVGENEAFTFTVAVENLAEESQLLYSIDIWDEYLAGITVIKSTPPFTDSFHVPLDNTQSYEYKLDIPPKGRVVIKFQAVGAAIGRYSSYLDVCINESASFISMPIVTSVE